MALLSGQRSFITLGAVFAIGVGAGAGLVYYLAKPARDDRPGAGPRNGASTSRVTARGRLEPESGVINLAASGPDILKKIRVKEGDPVDKDKDLAELASRDLRKIERDLANVQLEEATDRRKKTLDHLTAQQKESDARIRQIEAQGVSEVQVQEAKIQVLERQYNAAETLLARMRRAGSYAQQELDQQELLRLQAEQELNSARTVLARIKQANIANIEAARAQREANIAGLRRAESEVPLGTLQKGIELAKEKFELTAIRSPVRGRVLKILTREGEMVGAQPVFQVADPSVMVAVAEVYETDVKQVRDWFRSGKRVEAEVDVRFLGPTGGAKFRGQVVHVGSLVSKNSIFSVDPRQDVDRRVVEVRIRLDDQHHKEAAEFINMHVEVTILDPSFPKQE